MKPVPDVAAAADHMRRGRSRTSGGNGRGVSFACGQRIHSGGGRGGAWRVLSGSVRLDREEPTGEQSFAGLAVKGDIIGAESLLFDRYSFSATALAECVLAPWPEARSAAAGESLSRTLARAEQRAAEVIALRCGQAAERVRRLVLLLAHAPEDAAAAHGDLQVVLPSRQDMAEITALTLETVSRMVSQLRQAGMLAPQRLGRHFSQRRFSVRAPADEAR
jgi:CRP/FNR family nitrogen fixation transcriptional regulator